MRERILAVNNSFERYQQRLGFTKKDLGNFVLDLGSGYVEKFSKEAASHNITVISLNPALRKDTVREQIQEPFKGIAWQQRSIAGEGQHLPFKDETFSAVVSLDGVPLHIGQNYDEYTQTLQEVYRVTRTGGKAFLGPIPVDSLDLTKAALKELNYRHYFLGKPQNDIRMQIRSLIIHK